MANNQQVMSDFEKTGISHIPDFLDSGSLRELEIFIDEISIDTAREITSESKKVVKSANKEILILKNIWSSYSKFSDLINGEKLLEIVENKLNKKIELLYDEVSIKLPNGHSEYEWHSDAPLFNENTITVWLFISDAHVGRGGFSFVDNSHNKDNKLDSSKGKVLSPQIGAGSLFLLHSDLIHKGEKNTGPRSIKAYSAIFSAK